MAVWTISQGLTEKEYGFLAHIWCKPDAKDEMIIEDEIHHCLYLGLPRLTTKLLSDNLTNVFFYLFGLFCTYSPVFHIHIASYLVLGTHLWIFRPWKESDDGFKEERDQKSCWYLQHYSLCPIKFKFWVLVFHFTKQKALCSPSPSLLEGKLVSPSEDCVS